MVQAVQRVLENIGIDLDRKHDTSYVEPDSDGIFANVNRFYLLVRTVNYASLVPALFARNNEQDFATTIKEHKNWLALSCLGIGLLGIWFTYRGFCTAQGVEELPLVVVGFAASATLVIGGIVLLCSDLDSSTSSYFRGKTIKAWKSKK